MQLESLYIHCLLPVFTILKHAYVVSIAFFATLVRLGDSVKLNWKLESIQVASGSGYKLIYKTPEGVKAVLAKSVLLTVPSYVASNILRPLSVSDST